MALHKTRGLTTSQPRKETPVIIQRQSISPRVRVLQATCQYAHHFKFDHPDTTSGRHTFSIHGHGTEATYSNKKSDSYSKGLVHAVSSSLEARPVVMGCSVIVVVVHVKSGKLVVNLRHGFTSLGGQMGNQAKQACTTLGSQAPALRHVGACCMRLYYSMYISSSDAIMINYMHERLVEILFPALPALLQLK